MTEAVLDLPMAAHSEASLSTLTHPLAERERKCSEDLVRCLRARHRRKATSLHQERFSVREPRVWRRYFDLQAYSYRDGERDDHLEVERAALVAGLGVDLAVELRERLVGTASAEVMNTTGRADSDTWTRTYRFTELQQIGKALKGVWSEVDHFWLRTRSLAGDDVGTVGSSRSACWPHDAEAAIDGVLLGFSRSPAKDLLNSGVLRSTVLACGVTRSRLETIIFGVDLRSQLAGRERPQSGHWKDALRFWRDRGAIIEEERQWGTAMYGVLSEALHAGCLLTTAEVFMFNEVLDHLQTRMSAPLAPCDDGTGEIAGIKPRCQSGGECD